MPEVQRSKGPFLLSWVIVGSINFSISNKAGTFCEEQKLGGWYIGFRYWFKELPKFCRNGPGSIKKRVALTFNNNNTAFHRQYFYIINSNKLLILKTVLTYMMILSIQACTRDFSLHQLNFVPYPKILRLCG